MRNFSTYKAGNILITRDNRYVTVLEVLDDSKYRIRFRDDNTEAVFAKMELIPIHLKEELLFTNKLLPYCPVKEVFEILAPEVKDIEVYGVMHRPCGEIWHRDGAWQVHILDGPFYVWCLHELQNACPDIREQDFDLR